MDINYDYYRIFYYAAKYGSISRAAKMLLNDQPNLSRAIKNLEAALGKTLFIRSNRGITLTADGKMLYAHIRIAFEHIEAAEREINGSEGGFVFVAATEVALRCFLLPVLKSFRAAYPDVRLKIGNYSTPQAIDALKSGLADIAVVTTPDICEKSLISQPVAFLRETAVCGASFKKLSDRTVPLAELAKMPLVGLGENTKTYELYSDFFEKNGLYYDPDIVTATVDQIVPIVEADLGIGFVPEKLITDNVAVFSFETEPSLPEREICFIKRKSDSLSKTALALEEFILKASNCNK